MEAGMGSLSERGSLDAKWIVFRLGDRRFAIQAGVVKEILSLPAMKPSLLGGPGFFAAFSLRGELVYAFDLRFFWGEAPQPFSLDDDLLILEQNVAIPVQEVLEIREFDPPAGAPAAAQLIRSEAVWDGHVVSLLDSAKLAALRVERPDGGADDAAQSSVSRSKLRWFKRSFAGFSGADREILERRITHSSERSELSSLEGDDLVSLALIQSVDERFGIPIDEVLEFADPGQITPLPDASEALHGCINLRGEVVPVLSLAHLLGKPRKLSYDQGKVVLVQDDNLPVGLLVDDLLDVVRRKSSERVAASPTGRTEAGSLVDASFPEEDGGSLSVLHLESVFARARSLLGV